MPKLGLRMLTPAEREGGLLRTTSTPDTPPGPGMTMGPTVAVAASRPNVGGSAVIEYVLPTADAGNSSRNAPLELVVVATHAPIVEHAWAGAPATGLP